MKVCPKCNSSYSDETLNFCLTDGVPLVAEEGLEEYRSTHGTNWHNAETLHDGRFFTPNATQVTSSDTSSPTLNLPGTPTTSIQLQQAGKRPAMLYSLIGIILVVGVGFAAWWILKDGSAANVAPSPPAEKRLPQIKRVVVPLDPKDEERVKKEVADFLQSWKSANEKKDEELRMSHYVDTLDIYYDKSGVDKNNVRTDVLRAFKRYESIQLEIDKLKITPESTESATALFDKSWTMKGEAKTSTGSVQQEIHVSKINGKWLIDGEKDVKVYFINNRENAPADAGNSAAQPADKPAENGK